jgi:hypothetical protein
MLESQIILTKIIERIIKIYDQIDILWKYT